MEELIKVMKERENSNLKKLLELNDAVRNLRDAFVDYECLVGIETTDTTRALIEAARYIGIATDTPWERASDRLHDNDAPPRYIEDDGELY